MQTHKLSVIVPVYKGEHFIAKNLEFIKPELAKTFQNFEIICVIDGLVDRSLEEATKIEEVKILWFKKNQGKGAALKYGFDNSNGDVITFLDGDLDINPKQLKLFIPYMTTADLVIGSKRHPFSKLNYPPIRKLLSLGFQMYSMCVLGLNLRDTQSGIKLMKREVLEIILPLVAVKKYAFDLELCFLAQRQGFRIVEAPIMLDYQFTGSGIKFKAIIYAFLDVLAIRYRYSFLKYYQKKFHEIHFK